MWLFCRAGFVSVVEHRDRRDLLLVRARLQEDIEAIRERIGTEGHPDVEWREPPGADYRYRLLCPRDVFARVVGRLVSEIDYDNFKNAVHGNAVRDDAYMECWSAMNEAQWKTIRGAGT